MRTFIIMKKRKLISIHLPYISKKFGILSNNQLCTKLLLSSTRNPLSMFFIFYFKLLRASWLSFFILSSSIPKA